MRLSSSGVCNIMPQQHGVIIWTPHIQERLVELMADPVYISFSRIAAVMSNDFGFEFSRSSIARRVQRMGLPKHAPMPVKSFIALIEPLPELPHKGYTLFDVGPYDCKWPVDYIDGAHRFCCQPRVLSRPYCVEHVKRGYITVRR